MVVYAPQAQKIPAPIWSLRDRRPQVPTSIPDSHAQQVCTLATPETPASATDLSVESNKAGKPLECNAVAVDNDSQNIDEARVTDGED